uniref:NADH dehydrogenase subunit 6 n=1 Tax=Dryophiops rubescens TaxID=1899456 RepID=UPI00226C8B4C|nr:NADH dehydrogenase subunit 6 [Dryophiops rubescens]UZC57553.1 NADH dehydrogenase subunit 6 [Dryophiops rubescens]
MNYVVGFVLVFIVLGVVVLGSTLMPYQGVIAIMGISFFCCMLMVIFGRTFAALVMYIVYLGGLVVVFGYCVSVEKDSTDMFSVGGFKCFVIFVVVVSVLLVVVDEAGGLLCYVNWEDLVCLEVNGGGVFYSYGGVGLIVCSWGLLVVLFSILVVLSWSRLGGLRPF